MTSPSLRIDDGVTRGARVRFSFDGRDIDAYEGEPVAVALLASGVRNLGTSPARGLLCAMGVCQECAVVVDGRITESCRLPVRAGMIVRRKP